MNTTSLWWVGGLMGRCVLAFFFVVLGGAAFGQAVPSTDPIPRVVFPSTNVGNISTIGPMTADAANASKFSFGVAANGSVFANTGTQLPTAGGASIPLSVASSVPRKSVVAALGRFVGKTLPLLNTGVALYDLAQELDFAASNDPATSQAKFMKHQKVTNEDYYCNYNTAAHGGSAIAACTAAGADVVSASGSCSDASHYQFVIRMPWGALSNRVGGDLPAFSCTATVTTGPDRPATQQEFIDSVAAKSGWPSSSALARTLVDALKSGESAEVLPTTVTGPATGAPQAVVSTDPATGLQTTTQVAPNFSYSPAPSPVPEVVPAPYPIGQPAPATQNWVGPSVSTVINQTTNVFNPTTNTTTAGPSVTTTPVNTSPEPTDCEKFPGDVACAPMGQVTDTPLPVLPKIYTPRYPDGLQGVWAAKKAALLGSPLLSVTSSLMPAGFASGACPSFSLPLDIGPWHYGSSNVAPPCWLWDVGKAIVILSALLLARALVFGG